MKENDNKKYIDELINEKKWAEALFVLESKADDELSTSEIMQLGLIYFNLHKFEKGFIYFKKISWNQYNDCAWLRRMSIAPLIKEKNFIWAVKLLELILKAHPNSVLDLMTLSSVLIRQNKREEGCIYLEQILAIEKENYTVAARLIQLKFQDNKLDEALKLAECYEHAYKLNEQLLKISLLTLSKAGKTQFCIKKISDMDLSSQPLEVGIIAAQIAFDGSNYRLAHNIINQLQNLGCNDARIYLILAKLKLLQNETESEAINSLIKATEIEPQNIKINNLLGDLLLKAGNFPKALDYLQKQKTLLPENAQTRLLYARALKFTGKYQESANEMLEVIKLLPDSVKYKRYAASALAQAGRNDEAKSIFEEGLAIRNKKLLNTFEAGLSQLVNKLDTVNIAQPRFDWLWNIINNNGAKKPTRAEYEHDAKWVYLLDHYLIDWLECRPDQADEAMAFFDDLSEVYNVLKEKLSEGNGLILAGAHIGPLFSIPLALDLLGLPHKWLASTPSITSMPYRTTLISTSENTEQEVVRQIIKTLAQKEIIALAVDGAINPSAPKVNFENQKITYSDFAAKMAFTTKAPSFFITSSWKSERFCVQIKKLPNPSADENIEDFCSRWTEHYLSLLRNYLVKDPSNSRLCGGIWRFIKPQHDLLV